MKLTYLVPLLCSILLNLLFGWLLFLASPATHFASTYNEDGFMRISCQMLQQEVEDILGKPLQIEQLQNPENGIRWVYSTQANQVRGYDYRAIEFTKDGKIVRMNSYRYQD